MITDNKISHHQGQQQQSSCNHIELKNEQRKMIKRKRALTIPLLNHFKLASACMSRERLKIADEIFHSMMLNQ
ncbi:hypothetical protein T4D_4814 [Trichinella pseudospiralis]|uniref:Uncharacterized protein n=1 Tax=Trichinella pseudospiralis TaxID=6337 RepID=A0A0V1FIA2_TRIPS|nr:hypothetical protein T4D_4814 [Trichinella pseudospiralis]